MSATAFNYSQLSSVKILWFDDVGEVQIQLIIVATAAVCVDGHSNQQQSWRSQLLFWVMFLRYPTLTELVLSCTIPAQYKRFLSNKCTYSCHYEIHIKR